MSRRSDDVLLRHMAEAARAAARTVAGLSREELAGDEIRIAAATRFLEIIGEAAGQVSKEFRTLHPEVPWGQIVGMRNRLVHAYFDVNLDVLWETATVHATALAQRAEELLRRLTP